MDVIPGTRLPRLPSIEAAFALVAESPRKEDGVYAAELALALAKEANADALSALLISGGKMCSAGMEGNIRYLSSCFSNFIALTKTKTGVFPSAEVSVFTSGILMLENITVHVDQYSGDFEDLVKKVKTLRQHASAYAHITHETVLSSVFLSALEDAAQAVDKALQKQLSFYDFENSGLPNHAYVREVYETIRSDEVSTSRPRNARFDGSIGIARIIAETGASSDPDVYAAALLYQFRLPPLRVKGLMETARTLEFYNDCSTWPNIGAQHVLPITVEGRLIQLSYRLYLLEQMTRNFTEIIEKNIQPHNNLWRLEQLETAVEKLLETNPSEVCPRLRVRMAEAVIAAEKFMHTPQCLKIRQPYSPKGGMDS